MFFAKSFINTLLSYVSGYVRDFLARNGTRVFSGLVWCLEDNGSAVWMRSLFLTLDAK